METNKLSFKGVFLALMLLLIGNINAQYSGKSWNDTVRYDWTYSNCNSLNSCNFPTPNFWNDCFNGYCREAVIQGSPLGLPYHGGASYSCYSGVYLYGSNPVNNIDLYRYYQDTWYRFPNLFVSKLVENLYGGLRIFAINSDSIYIIDNNNNYTSESLNGLSNIDIVEYQNTVILTTNTGIYSYNNTTWTLMHSTNIGLNSKVITNADKIWIMDADSIIHYNGTSWTSFNSLNSDLLANQNIQDIEVDYNNKLWVVYFYNDEVVSFDGSNWETTILSSSFSTTTKIMITNNNDVLVGGENKLFYYSSSINIWSNLNPSFSIVSNYYQNNSLIDGYGYLWVSTENDGLSAYDLPSLNLIKTIDAVEASDSCHISLLEGQMFVSNESWFLPNNTTAQYHSVNLNEIKAFSDTFTIVKNTTLSNGNLIENDSTGIYSTIVSSLYNINTMNGVFNNNFDGSFNYTPNLNFIGIDTLQYTISNSYSPVDEDTARIYISIIQGLTAIDDTFTTLLNTPITDNVIINDSIANYSISSSILNTPDNGVAILNSNGNVNYIPNSNYTGLDSFEYYICTITSPFICDTAKIYIFIEMLSTDSIWPGDANSNGVANVWDILPIGVGYNSSGVARPNATTNWIGQACPDWPLNFSIGVNYKHTDCDGNGIVDLFDVQAIADNYGLTHSKGESGKSGAGIPLYFDFNPSTYMAGDVVTGTINLGTIDTPALNIYGLAFSINYDNTFIEENSVAIDFAPSWLAPASANVSLTKDFWSTSKIDFGHCKIDQTNENGSGVLATITFNIQENLAGKTNEEIQKMMELSFSDVFAINSQYEEIDINAKTDTLYATQIIDGLSTLSADLDVKVFPNPFNNILRIESLDKISRITIYNVLGEIEVNVSNIGESKTQLNLEKLNNGIYVIRIASFSGKSNQYKLFKL